jgi:hypothetical protein
MDREISFLPIQTTTATSTSTLSRSTSVVSSASLLAQTDDKDKEKENKLLAAVEASVLPAAVEVERPSASELRVAQYEKSLSKFHRSKTLPEDKRDPEKLAKKRSEKRQRSAVLKDKIVKMIESGLQLSEYQSRKAFSVYLHCILHRLSDFDSESGHGSLQQIELVLKFLQKAALSLREPYFLKAPNGKLSGKDRAAIVAKELNEFLGHYRRETEVFTVFREEPGMVPRHVFEEFVAFANDSDMEDVLTLQTKMYRCAHIFLGKCLAPVTGGKNSLLRTAYGISPDRNLRDRQCSMRMHARSNPPIAPQFQLPPPAPTKCLDITTYEKSKLEELQDLAEDMEDEGGDDEGEELRKPWKMAKRKASDVKKPPEKAEEPMGRGKIRGMVSAVTVARHLRRTAAAAAKDTENEKSKECGEKDHSKNDCNLSPPTSLVPRSASAPSNLDPDKA